MRRRLATGLLAAGMLAEFGEGMPAAADPVILPARVDGPKRPVTVEDVLSIRDIATLSTSPDGKKFAILVRQADAERNTYDQTWFVGRLAGGVLTAVADGGEVRQLLMPDGRTAGDLMGVPARWSADGTSIAFAVRQGGGVQLWLASPDGSGARQVTHSDGDVGDYGFTGDGRRLLFTANGSRAGRAAAAERHAREGTRLQDFGMMVTAISGAPPPVPQEPDPPLFSVSIDGSDERPATSDEVAQFDALRASDFKSPVPIEASKIAAAVQPPVAGPDGAVAWLAKADPAANGAVPIVRLHASLSGREQDALSCNAAACAGQGIQAMWWAGADVLFLVYGGPTHTEFAVHRWTPSTGAVRLVYHLPDGSLTDCSLVSSELICLKADRLVPPYVAGIDIGTGRVRQIADVNPEVAQFELGRVERIEWDTLELPGTRGNYPARSRAYIHYPPGYDPNKSYPLFVAPYGAWGFVGDVGFEHPLLAYSAAGMVVLNSEFPVAWGLLERCETQVCAMQALYDPATGFPHISLLAANTFKAIDEASKSANIDPKRVGIGGTSQGSLMPLFMIQTEDRIAAASFSNGSWAREEYYATAMPDPWANAGADPVWPKDEDFWKPLDLSYHLDRVEAPILFNFADRELFLHQRLARDLADAHVASEAYVYSDEYHVKLHPAHRLSVTTRNLDWFRFWLLDLEDPDPRKAEQYDRWRKLRELQCRNPRAVRGNYCERLPSSDR